MNRFGASFRTIVPVAALMLIAVMGCNPQRPPSPAPIAGLPPGVKENPGLFRADWAHLPRDAGKVRPRPAKCAWGGCSVDIEITVLGTAVPSPDNPAATGYPIAVLRNLDPTDEEARYDLEPATKAEYYLWIDAVPGARKTRYSLLRVPISGGRVRNTHSKQIAVCHDRGGKPITQPDVDFAEFRYRHGSPCRVADATSQPTVQYAAMSWINALGTLASRFMDRGPFSAGAAAPIWIDCDTGCCT